MNKREDEREKRSLTLQIRSRGSKECKSSEGQQTLSSLFYFLLLFPLISPFPFLFFPILSPFFPLIFFFFPLLFPFSILTFHLLSSSSLKYFPFPLPLSYSFLYSTFSHSLVLSAPFLFLLSQLLSFLPFAFSSLHFSNHFFFFTLSSHLIIFCFPFSFIFPSFGGCGRWGTKKYKNHGRENRPSQA